MAEAVQRALIDRATRRITLPVPRRRGCRFSIRGVWGDPAMDGPDSTTVELRCSSKNGPSGSYRLTKDSSFLLPTSVEVAVTVLFATTNVALEVAVSPEDSSSGGTNGK